KGLGGASGSLLAAYSYDESSNGIGRRTSMIAYDPPDVVHNSANWTYDSLGRVTQESRTIGSQSYTFQYGYTQGDLPVSIRYPGGAAGQLGETVYTNYWWQTGQPKNSIGLIQDEYFSYITQATYDFPHGQMDQLVYGNNQQTDYTYDAAFRLKTVTHSEGYQNLEYEYDAVGNVTQILDRFYQDTFNNPFYRHFYYDSLNRLVRATGDHVVTFDFDESYAYDPIGNIVNKAGDCLGYGEVTGSGECGGAPATGPQPHAVTYLNGDQKFWYDVNGNMTRRIDEQNQDWTLTWTPENMLHNATDGTSSVTFVYDADGMMVQRTENGQTTNYLGKLFEHNVTLGSFTKHYQFGGRLAAVRTGLSSSSPVSFLLTDHLGSTTATVFAGTGGLQSLRQYTAWGEEYSSYNVTPTGYRYTSQRWDSGLGLYDYNARYYDPHIGKFISADTLVPDPASPQAFNRYAYVLGNPLRYSDPTGHFTEEAIMNYLTGAFRDDAQYMFELWKSDSDWWSMLLEAEAGDILIGHHRGIEYFHTFRGEGNSLLEGIFASDANGDSIAGGFKNAFNLMNYFRGKMPSGNCNWVVNGRRFDNAGFIRWRDNRPSFYLREGYTLEQRYMPEAIHYARYGVWWFANAYAGTKFITGILWGTLYSVGASALDVPGWIADATGTTPNDVTVTFFNGHSYRAGTQVFRGFNGLWVATNPRFED
ncbi:MAG: RHS repeat-associated core domain-containing protein, partial [Rhizobiaceae bacterium]